ncbi:MAG: hypothetical protein EG823_01995, partial [Actinobacteria bacterium]|nr:hypothetical protein [Actinomycetota bacterium]
LGRAGLIERGEAHRLVGEHLAELRVPGLLAVGHFTSLTSAQEAFVVGASSRTDVIVTATFVDGLPATAAAAGLVGRLRQIAVEEVSGGGGGGIPLELQRLDRDFTRQGVSGARSEGRVVLSEAWGQRAEAARIASEVQTAVASGIEPGEVAVVVRDAGSRLEDLRSALDEVGIPAEFDARAPFHATGIGRVVLSLLELGCGSGSYERLIDTLRSPFSPVSGDVLDRLDRDMRRRGSLETPAAESWLRDHDQVGAHFVRECRQACGAVGTPAGEMRWYRVVSGMLGRAYPAVAVADPAFMADAAAARILSEGLRGLGAITAGNACQVLTAALREASVTLRSEGRPECVQVMGAERVRGLRYRCVILAGLNAGEFPRPTVDDALSAPEVLRVFERAGIDLSPRGDTDAERLLFYSAITRATERLVLSWQSHDSEGRPRRPSPFLEELLDLYRDPASRELHDRGLPHRLLRLDGHSLDPEAPATDRREFRAQAAARDPGAGSRVLSASRRALQRYAATSEAVRRAMRQRESFSASEIEMYLQCPYRWYVERLVRPDELDLRFDMASAGRLAHEIMRRFYDALTDTGEERVTPANLQTALALHAEIAEALVAKTRTTAAIEEALLRAAARKTGRLVEADAVMLPDMRPAYREWSFGLDDGDAPESFGEFSLVGRIDRIDTGNGDLVVTDYKLGSVNSARAQAKFVAAGLVQLPLYAAVASRRHGLGVAGGLYRSMNGGRPRGFVRAGLGPPGAFVSTDVLTGEQIVETVESAVARAAEAVERMRDGRIEARPLSGSCLPYCAARAFCKEWRPGRG